MPVYLTDLTPDWLKRLRPENASVFDSPGIKLARWIASLTGVADPQAQVTGIMAPMETGPSGGLAGMMRSVKAGWQAGAPAATAATPAITAYHGSPHDFDQFSTAKIGTGEGAQAYGHGLYFAEDPAVASTYRHALSNPEVEFPSGQRLAAKVLSKPTADQQAEDIALAHLETFVAGESADPWASARRDLTEKIDRGLGRGLGLTEKFTKARELIDQWQQQGARIVPGGKTYEVNIHADPAHFLDWDAPLSQQSPQVQQMLGYKGRPSDAEVESMFALAKKRGVDPATMPEYEALQARLDDAAQLERRFPTGEAIYRNMSHDIQGATMQQPGAGHLPIRDAYAQASDRLGQAGIPGIKYLDAGSRAAGAGTRNYVVFDDKLVSIAKKYMLAGLGVEEAIRRASQDLGRQQAQGPS